MGVIYVHLADGFEEVEALTPVDVLRRCGADVKTVSIMEGKIVSGAHGIRVEADLLFEEADYGCCDMIVLPGGMPGAANLQAHAGLKEQILRFDREGKKLAAICAAPMVYGELGLLSGRSAVCYPGMEAHLKGARIAGERVIIDGHFITSMGPGTASDFALTLAAVVCGEKAADAVAQDMLLR